MRALNFDDIALLDGTMAMLDAGSTSKAIDDLRIGLHILRSQKGPHAWQDFVETVCKVHPLAERLKQDPFTRRSIEKPRGYSGDAVLLDLIYSGLSDDHAAGISDEGIRIFEATRTESQSAIAVRDRKELLTGLVDEVANRVPSPRILSVACGHLREALSSNAVRERRIAEFIGLDQDPDSLKVVEHELAAFNVKAVPATIRDLLKGTVRFTDFDLVYSAGLYDYLDQQVATRLTQVLFGSLRSGGKLLVANFVPDYGTAGYMEAFMDWRLICRDADELAATAASIDPAHVASKRTFHSANGYIVYLELTRR